MYDVLEELFTGPVQTCGITKVIHYNVCIHVYMLFQVLFINNSVILKDSKSREYLCALLDAILFLCKQELPLRGHREGKASKNKSKFLELLDLLSKSDPDFKNLYEPCPNNANYTHPEIQNELIDASAQVILNEIKCELTEAEY